MPKTQTKRPATPHFNPYPKLGFWGRALCSPFQWRTTQRLLQHILLATALAWLWAGLRCGLWLPLFSTNTTCSNQDYYNALYRSLIVLQLVTLYFSSRWLWRRSTEGAEQFKYYALTGQGYFELRSGFLDGFVWSKLLILNAGVGVAAMFALGSVTSSGLIQTLNLPPSLCAHFQIRMGNESYAVQPAYAFLLGSVLCGIGSRLIGASLPPTAAAPHSRYQNLPQDLASAACQPSHSQTTNIVENHQIQHTLQSPMSA